MAAQEYQDLVSRPGWNRFRHEVEKHAKDAADAMINARRGANETIEQFVFRLSQYQQIIAGARIFISIPRDAIDAAEELEDEKQNDTRRRH